MVLMKKIYIVTAQDKHHNAKGYQLLQKVYPSVKAIEQLNEKNYE